MLDHVFGTETIVQNQPTSQTPLDDETSQAFLETQQDYSFKLVDFFELLNVCISNLHIENSEFYKETLILVQKKYMSFDGLFQFYCKFFSKFFWQKKEDAIKDVLLFVTGWLGFLMCMNKRMPSFFYYFFDFGNFVMFKLPKKQQFVKKQTYCPTRQRIIQFRQRKE